MLGEGKMRQRGTQREEARKGSGDSERRRGVLGEKNGEGEGE